MVYKNYCLILYDLEDNIISYFEDYKEASNYLNKAIDVIQCYISRKKKGIVKHILYKGNRYVLEKVYYENK